MSRHFVSRQRAPRAHWLLLLLALAALLTLLAFNGYASGLLGGSGRPHQPEAADGVAPAAVSNGGPIIRLDGDTPISRSVPNKTIALTFDDGPDPIWTPRILDLLAEHDAKATFFVLGARVNEHPELTRRILDEGHELGSHTFTHVELATAGGWRRDLEITLTANAIAGATGQHTSLFRPPFSAGPDALTGTDYATLSDIAKSGYIGVLTDLDSKDWQRPGVDAIVEASMPRKGSGAVVLMHDAGGDRSQTLAALAELIPKAQADGYRFTTISGAIDAPSAMTPAPEGMHFRGSALRLAQTLAAVTGTVMTALLFIALALSVLRLLVQLGAVRVHLRRVDRRWRPDRWEILDPVSVVVPAFNEAANIAATVRSLCASDYPFFEVIVVDDGSTDETAWIVESLGLSGVRVIRQPNTGKPGALNTGIRAARGELLVLVDGDTVFQPDTLYNLVQGFADPHVGAIAGNTKVANRGGLLGRWQHLEYVIGFNLDRRLFDVARCMPTIPGAIGAFRAATLRDVSGVGADTLAEDTDLTMAILRAGWEITYCEHAIAWTEAPATVRQLWSQRYRWCYGTMQAMWKHRRALTEPTATRDGGGGRLGRRAMPYLALFQIALPLTAPAVDIFALYGLIFLPWQHLALAWIGLLGLQAVAAGVALKLDRESLRPLWSLPLQQVVYRQLMYLVVVQSTVTALVGNRLAWHRLNRTGSAAAHHLAQTPH